ncbi:hypothetical protein GCM10009714_34700 [Microlunatus capsulatus]
MEVALLLEVVGSVGVAALTDAVLDVLRSTRSAETRPTTVMATEAFPASAPTVQVTSWPSTEQVRPPAKEEVR